MTPSAQQDEKQRLISEMHARRMLVENLRLESDKAILIELRELNSNIKALSALISSKVAVA